MGVLRVFAPRRGKDVVAAALIGYRPELTKRNVLSPWDKKLWRSLWFNCGPGTPYQMELARSHVVSQPRSGLMIYVIIFCT